MNYSLKSFSVPMGSGNPDFSDRWEQTFGKKVVKEQQDPYCEPDEYGYIACPYCRESTKHIPKIILKGIDSSKISRT